MNINISLFEKTEKTKETNTYELCPSPLSQAQPNHCPPTKPSLELGSLIKVCTTAVLWKTKHNSGLLFSAAYKWGLASSTLLHNFVANLNSFSCSDKPVPHWQGGHLHPPPAAGGQHHQVHRERLHPLQRGGRNQRWPVVLLLWFQVCYNTKLVQLSRVSSKPSERILRGNSLLWI